MLDVKLLLLTCTLNRNDFVLALRTGLMLFDFGHMWWQRLFLIFGNIAVWAADALVLIGLRLGDLFSVGVLPGKDYSA